MQTGILTHYVSEIGSLLGTEETNRKYIWKVISNHLVWTDRQFSIYISKLIFVNYVDYTFSENTTIFIRVVRAVREP